VLDLRDAFDRAGPLLEEQVDLLDAFVVPRVTTASDRERVSSAMRLTEHRRARIAAAEVASVVACSQRQLDRSCARLVGVPPKLHARTVRMRE
jgi:methylphosphotriester-DNA--protein-cysteine methyltransferase